MPTVSPAERAFFPLGRSGELGNRRRSLFACLWARLHPPRNYLKPTRGFSSSRAKKQLQSGGDTRPKRAFQVAKFHPARHEKTAEDRGRGEEEEEDRTRGQEVLALSIISYEPRGQHPGVLIELQANHYLEFHRLISKSAFCPRVSFLSPRLLGGISRHSRRT